MDIQKFINEYLLWLKNEITFQKTGEYYEITAPFLDMDNDYLQIYVKQSGNSICFSDDGYTINALKAHGFTMTATRKKQMAIILAQFGVKLDGMELKLEAPAEEYPVHKHMFFQAILRVCDLCTTIRSRSEALFTDDIRSFLDSREIYCTQNIILMGQTGYAHNYDFVMQRSRRKPTRFCVALNQPTKTSMSNTLFSWIDTKNARTEKSTLIVFLNDSQSIPQGIENGLRSYDASTIRWSQIDTKENMELLSA